MIKTQVVKLKVNKAMQKHLNALCDYRRYCWNKCLETWQYDLSTRYFQLAIKDLANAWKNSLTSRNLIGTSLNLNQRRLHGKALKQIELKLLMASFGLISQ